MHMTYSKPVRGIPVGIKHFHCSKYVVAYEGIMIQLTQTELKSILLGFSVNHNGPT